MNKSAQAQAPQPVLVIMGVSGSGKSTVAGILAGQLGWDLAEGDDLHPAANVAKMASGTPLTDEDRWPWLDLVADWITRHTGAGVPGIITCSALRRGYRDKLAGPNVVFVHLAGNRNIIGQRLNARMDHFMPPTLLDSQIATLEPPQADERALTIAAGRAPAEEATEIIRRLGLIPGEGVVSQPFTPHPEHQAVASRARVAGMAEIGVTGLAVMGSNLARNFAGKGFVTAVHNRSAARTTALMADHGTDGAFIPSASAADFVHSLATPRKIIIMVKAGAPTDAVIDELAGLLEPGDILIDGGNAKFQDTRRREAALRKKGIHFVGCGISGGEEGALKGPSIMPGGSVESYQSLGPILEKIAAQVDGDPCCTHIGADGAGHFVKMIHNGIEYADMQLIAEACDLLRRGAGLEPAAIADIFEEWNRGDLDSFLIEITAEVLRHVDADTGKPFVDVVVDAAGMKGTGTWTVQTALDLGVPVSGIAEAVFARGLSSATDQRVAAVGKLAGPDGHHIVQDPDAFVEDVRKALYASKIIAYAQGLDVIAAGAGEYGWDIDLGAVARIWRGGCIIRAKFLNRITAAYSHAAHAPASLILAPYFTDVLADSQRSWRRTLTEAVQSGIPTPGFAAALAYYDGLRSARLPASIIQGQRDFFGAHTYQRVDRQGNHHTQWSGDRTEISI
jgi:6-phosphogluconate dehydrogenase